MTATERFPIGSEVFRINGPPGTAGLRGKVAQVRGEEVRVRWDAAPGRPAMRAWVHAANLLDFNELYDRR